jgi:hypothetical protein
LAKFEHKGGLGEKHFERRTLRPGLGEEDLESRSWRAGLGQGN